MSNTKPDTPIWVLCTTLGDITDGQVNIKVHHHGANFYAHLEDCKLDDPSDTLPSPVTKAKKVRYKRNKMKVGDKVLVECEVVEAPGASNCKVHNECVGSFWVANKFCKPIESEPVEQTKFVHRPELGDTVVFPNGLRIVVHDNNEQGFTVVQDAPESEAVEQANTIKFKVGDPVITWDGRKGIVTDIYAASEHSIRVMLNPFSFVHCKPTQVTRGTPEIDSSMRQLNWNEVIQDGDVLVTINDRYAGYKQPLTIYAIDSIGKRVDDAFSKGKKLGLTKLFYRRIEKGTK
jgi:preprotein translocase subunit YajC